MATVRHKRPATATVGRRVGTSIILVLGAALAPTHGLDAEAAPGDPGGFAAQVTAHFEEWDLDRDGALSFFELGRLVPAVRIKGEAAAALAAIHRIRRRGKNPTWHHAAFTLSSILIGEDGERGDRKIRHRPAFERNYRQCLAHLRATRRELFAPGAPSLRGIHQGPLGDCYLIGAVGAVVNRDPETLRAMIDPLPDGTFLVRFPGGPVILVSSVSDAEIMLGSSDGDQGIWLNVIEKAYGQRVLADRRRDVPAIDALWGARTATETLQLFTGRAGYRLRFRPRGSPHVPDRALVAALSSPARAILIAAKRDRRLTCCGTTKAAAPPGIAPNHSYAVLGYDPARDVVHVWNPWGNEFQFTPAGPPGLEAGYPVQDGHFSVTLDDFIRIFAAMTHESRTPAWLSRTGNAEDAERQGPHSL